jgi:hypothetical protein
MRLSNVRCDANGIRVHPAMSQSFGAFLESVFGKKSPARSTQSMMLRRSMGNVVCSWE